MDGHRSGRSRRQHEATLSPLRADRLRELVASYEADFGAPLIPTWVFGNPDRARRIDRLGGDVQRAKLNAALQLTARGAVPLLRRGDRDAQVRIPRAQAKDPLATRMRWAPQLLFDAVRRFAHESVNRDEERTPMQWSAGPNAGFCPAGVTPWLPTARDPSPANVEDQRGDPGRCCRATAACSPRGATPRRCTGAT